MQGMNTYPIRSFNGAYIELLNREVLVNVNNAVTQNENISDNMSSEKIVDGNDQAGTVENYNYEFDEYLELYNKKNNANLDEKDYDKVVDVLLISFLAKQSGLNYKIEMLNNKPRELGALVTDSIMGYFQVSAKELYEITSKELNQSLLLEKIVQITKRWVRNPPDVAPVDSVVTKENFRDYILRTSHPHQNNCDVPNELDQKAGHAIYNLSLSHGTQNAKRLSELVTKNNPWFKGKRIIFKIRKLQREYITDIVECLPKSNMTKKQEAAALKVVSTVLKRMIKEDARDKKPNKQANQYTNLSAQINTPTVEENLHNVNNAIPIYENIFDESLKDVSFNNQIF